MTIWAVIEDTRGAHETDTVWSLWSTRELAEAERARMLTAREALYGHLYSGTPLDDGEHLHIREVTIDVPRDTPIES
jgi:hypothetical protein